jgi:L-threonylcarbamoyladenylate synthase
MTVVLAPDAAGIAKAASALQRGLLVAFPTETVYGLGALALQERAVREIFRIKGRPATNPVIVHVLGIEAAAALSAGFTRTAEALALAFWPGPLTLVVARGPSVPSVVTAGGMTVAIRAPSHPVAQALLRAVGAPIAAPSANRSTEVSPTRAEHVLASLGDTIPFVIDGGPCEVGIESTVVDVTGEEPVILRPGTITRRQIADALGLDGLGNDRVSPRSSGAPVRSPGQQARHYAPRARVLLVKQSEIQETLDSLDARGIKAGVIGCGHAWRGGITLPNMPGPYAQRLYATLHALDQQVDTIIVELPPSQEGWEAVLDRLRRASTAA